MTIFWETKFHLPGQFSTPMIIEERTSLGKLHPQRSQSFTSPGPTIKHQGGITGA